MDNATFHKGGRIEQLIQEAGCELLYLPAYSPDFNRKKFCGLDAIAAVKSAGACVF
jgi:transposase